ncbi:MAG: TolC family outer membrane protein, partial [Pseudomonadota bacterium]|nr:TolC family outer membrane protein [Pseudomonadota bacterium]
MIALSVLCLFCPAPAFAESLGEALASAYRSNPTLEAERARLRALDEELARAKAGMRPSVSADLDVGRTRTNIEPRSNAAGTGALQLREGGNWPSGYALTVTQPLFRGLRTINAIREAEATIKSGRESLRTVEQQVLLDATTAYVDVLRDQAIVRLRENNLRVLSEQYTATKDRFDVGEVTRTDVAQAEARRAGSVSQLNLAQGNLKASRAVYEQIIGHPPGQLVVPPDLNGHLPHRLDDALTIGAAENPSILSATYLEEASRYEVKQIIGETLPEVSVEASYGERFDPSLSVESQESTTVTGRLRVPLYSGGEPSARVRQARQTSLQRRLEIDQARVKTRADVISAWSRLAAARAQIESDETQVNANKIALNGVREEEKVGQRTVLDVLDAEQEFLDSQVSLVGSKRDKVVASFTLMQAIGRLDADAVGLQVERYDAEEHYYQVKGKLFGFSDRPGLKYKLFTPGAPQGEPFVAP